MAPAMIASALLLLLAAPSSAFAPPSVNVASKAGSTEAASSRSSLFASPSDGDDVAATETRTRREVLTAVASAALSALGSVSTPNLALADEDVVTAPPPPPPIEVYPTGDVKKLYGEGRVLESQGNMNAALRIYSKVTKIAPRFVYGWSSLGNAQVALGDLRSAEGSYTEAVDLCRAKNAEVDGEGRGGRRCDDFYVLLLNRGSLRLNDGRPKDALKDLEESAVERGRPDALVLQNRARAREMNGYYFGADQDYSVAISMTSNEVSPFWLRAAMVRFQLGNTDDAFNLLRRVEVRFPEAPEVRAAGAAMRASRGEMDDARALYLKIPDRARLRFVDNDYLERTVAWPPKMKEKLREVSVAAGDLSS
uniref:Uncharacterized protein n=1 Tax=Trieres chinensis TaxID=1514140 RepID=A0A7S1ZHW3_TRICV|mmetsp:Transcript_25651/g.52533  ORF Transcript_25651/g.52533 Transcript_25651/m.52533 type:complete len:366 (+) Transcript_25651:36-1133(+)